MNPREMTSDAHSDIKFGFVELTQSFRNGTFKLRIPCVGVAEHKKIRADAFHSYTPVHSQTPNLRLIVQSAAGGLPDC